MRIIYFTSIATLYTLSIAVLVAMAFPATTPEVQTTVELGALTVIAVEAPLATTTGQEHAAC